MHQSTGLLCLTALPSLPLLHTSTMRDLGPLLCGAFGHAAPPPYGADKVCYNVTITVELDEEIDSTVLGRLEPRLAPMERSVLAKARPRRSVTGSPLGLGRSHPTGLETCRLPEHARWMIGGQLQRSAGVFYGSGAPLLLALRGFQHLGNVNRVLTTLSADVLPSRPYLAVNQRPRPSAAASRQ